MYNYVYKELNIICKQDNQCIQDKFQFNASDKLVDKSGLASSYKIMALDKDRENEANVWANGTFGWDVMH